MKKDIGCRISGRIRDGERSTSIDQYFEKGSIDSLKVKARESLRPHLNMVPLKDNGLQVQALLEVLAHIESHHSID